MPDTIDMLTRRAPAARADKLNVEERTVEVIWAAGAKVRRRGYDGPYVEELSMDPKHVRLDRLNTGASLLDSHRPYSMENRVGTVVPGSARIAGGKGYATVRLSSNDLGETLLRDLEAGHRLQISVGYAVHKSERREGDDEELPIIRATDWEPMELSAVPIPADPAAHTRSMESTMPHPVTRVRTISTPSTVPNDEDLDELHDAPDTRQRALGIAERRALVTRHIDLEDQAEHRDLVDAFLKRTRGATEDQVRTALLDLKVDMQERNFRPIAYGDIRDRQDPAVRTRAMAEALHHRIAPSKDLSAEARDFAGLTIPELARRCLEHRGEGTTGMAPAQLVTRALHTTSDFPQILGDTVGRTLRAAYKAAPSGIKLLSRRTTAPDFRNKHSLQFSAAPDLRKMNEHGEFESGTMEESKESYKLATYGRVFGLTRQSLINDDLGAFDQVPAKLGRAAEAFEAQQLVDLLTTAAGLGPIMSDTKRLFHTDHKNFDGTGAYLSVDSLSAARLAMRKQVGLTGELISVTPKFLLVPPDLETRAEQVLAELAAATVDGVNPFSGKLTLVVEPRLSDDKRWYVVAATGEVDGLEHCHLEGTEGPEIETHAGFKVDGIEIKVRLDFGCGFVDHRSWYANKGASAPVVE